MTRPDALPALLDALRAGDDCPLCGKATKDGNLTNRCSAIAAHVRQKHAEAWQAAKAARGAQRGGVGPRGEEAEGVGVPPAENLAVRAQGSPSGVSDSRHPREVRLARGEEPCPGCGGTEGFRRGHVWRDGRPTLPAEGGPLHCPDCGVEVLEDMRGWVKRGGERMVFEVSVDVSEVPEWPLCRYCEERMTPEVLERIGACEKSPTGIHVPLGAYRSSAVEDVTEAPVPLPEEPTFGPIVAVPRDADYRELMRLQRVEKAVTAVVGRFVDPAGGRCTWCEWKYKQMKGHYEGKEPGVRPCPIDVLERALAGEEASDG